MARGRECAPRRAGTGAECTRDGGGCLGAWGCAHPNARRVQVTAHACAALTNMAFRNVYNSEFIRKANGTGGIAPLVRLLSAGPSRDVTKYAAGAIANLTFDSDENCAAVLAANGVPPLSALLRAALEPGGSGANEATSFAIDALRNLSRCNDAARDAAREAGALPLLVALLGADRKSVV